MEVHNNTPFAHLLYANEDAQARLFDVLIVKASYHFDPSFTLVRSIEQEPLNFSDACFGEVNETSLRYPSDLVPYKPDTDVILIADAFAPEARPLPSWSVSLRAGHIERSLNVTGPRKWYRNRMGNWELSAPDAATRVPMRYELSYGGEATHDDGPAETNERNPLGMGVVHPKALSDLDTLAAPQITAPNDPLGHDLLQEHTPASFGPIPPAWLPRRPLGGTYDDEWVQNRWPHWAKDYDFAFHNSAADGLKYRGHMVGNEQVTLTNLHPDRPTLTFNLPDERMIARLVGVDGSVWPVTLALDTVYIDILDAPPEDCLVALTWRMPFLDASLARIEIDTLTDAQKAGQGDPTLLPAGHPSSLFAPTPEVAHV